MLSVSNPYGVVSRVPESISEDEAYFGSDNLADAAEYYRSEGYVVLRGLIPRPLFTRVRDAYASQLRRSRVAILRQKNMRYERNEFDEHGFLSNPIFNVQDLGTSPFGHFRDAVLDVLTFDGVARATRAFLGAETKLIQSMFFEAPANTWAHQDSYYQDSARSLGGCVAGWFALEDIDAGAGRFFVCPRSHTDMPLIRNGGAANFADGHETYKDAMARLIREHQPDVKAPFLAAGDVLFWSSLTIHGSFPASRAGVSRTSLTAHYLRDEDEMLQFHTRIRPQATKRHNGMRLGMLHDQDQIKNRLVREIAFHMPGPYRLARRLALRALMSRGPKVAPAAVETGGA